MSYLTDMLNRRGAAGQPAEQTQVTPPAPQPTAQPLQPTSTPQVTTPTNAATQLPNMQLPQVQPQTQPMQQVQEQQTPRINPDDYTSVYDMVRLYTKPQTYESEIKQAEKNRKLAQLTDIIGMAGNIGTLLAGRRLYGQPVSATQMANDRLEKLRALNREGQQRYDNALLNARLKDQEIKRAEQQRKAQMDFQERMAQRQAEREDAKWRAQLAYQMERDKLDRDARDKANKDNLNLQNRRLAADIAQAQERLNIQKANVMNRKKANDRLNPLVPILGKNGRRISVRKNSLNAITAYLYKKMQDTLTNSTDPKDKKTLSDINLMMNQAGDNKDKMASVVMQRLQDFPELEAELENIQKLNELYPEATAEEWNTLLNGNIEGDFDVWDPEEDGSDGVIEYKHK